MHIPVLYQEVIDALKVKDGSRFIDATVGAGGHAAGILTASSPDGVVLALDRDPDAIAFARQRLSEFKSRIILVSASYEEMADVANDHGFSDVDGVLMDLGLSSRQLEDGSRGFSFREDGPLDMRYNPSSGETAAGLINTLPEDAIADIIWRYGEVQHNRKIARAIARERPFDSTVQLAQLISAESRSRGKIHPATQVFQALRIAVNDELEVLARGLSAATDILKIGGRLAVISFHSLEDRIVKRFMRDKSRVCHCPPEQPICTCDAQPVLRLVNRKVIRPTEYELQSNPRSRSARMRVAEKITGD